MGSEQQGTRGPGDLINVDQTFGTAYEVRLPAFQGPVALLLHLIEREEMEISEVSLVAVTDQYLHTISQLEALEAAALAGFLDVASRLLYIKSNRILPRPLLEEEDEEDAGDALVRHLMEYRLFKQAANSLRERADMGHRAFVRPATPAANASRSTRLHSEALTGTEAPWTRLSGADLSGLQAALKRALERIPVEAPAPAVRLYTVTVAEQIEHIRSHVRLVYGQASRSASKAGITFSDLLSETYSRIEVIVTFLAVLELFRLRELHVQQSGTFGEILLLPVDSMAEPGPPGLIPGAGPAIVDLPEDED